MNKYSLSHTQLKCQYHIIFIPKYRQKVLYGMIRADIREIIRKLCAYKKVDIIEGAVCIDHVHLCLSIPPKESVSNFMGYLKGRSAIKIFEALDYYEIMNIKEDDVIYYKDTFELAIKFIENSDILIEIETEPNTEWSTIENIKKIISKMNIPIEKDNYFIKKAENELNKILKR